jgi:hypothetical protein
MKIQIDPKRLEDLEKKERRLEALEMAGVDNWDGYGIALREIAKEEETEELQNNIFYDMTVILSGGAYEPSERGAGCIFTDEAELEALNVFKAGLAKLEKLKSAQEKESF